MHRDLRWGAVAIAVLASASVARAADYVWTGGDYFAGGLPVPIGKADVVTATGGAAKSFSRGLESDGLLVWRSTADAVFDAAGTTFVNRGTFEAAQGVTLRGRRANVTFDNAGALVKSGGSDELVVQTRYVQRAGAVSDAGIGTIRYAGGGTFQGGRFVGSGRHVFDAADTTPFVFDAGPEPTDSPLVFAGGRFQNATGSRLDFSANGAWDGGRLVGHWGVAAGRTLTVGQRNGHVVDGDFTNDGVIRWTASDGARLGLANTTFTNNGSLLIESAGTVGTDLRFKGYASAIGLLNAGTITKSVGTGRLVFDDLALVNTGAIESRSGTVVLPDAWRNDGTLRGTAAFAAKGLHNAGDIAPGTDGGPDRISALQLTGDLEQDASSTLSFEIASSGSSDLLAVTGRVALDGRLRVLRADGYVPQLGDEFTVMSFASASGLERLRIEELGFDPATRFHARIDDGTRLVLSVSAVPEPSTWLLMALGVPMLAVMRRRGGARSRR